MTTTTPANKIQTTTATTTNSTVQGSKTNKRKTIIILNSYLDHGQHFTFPELTRTVIAAIPVL